jgi:hypothetical protein
MAIKTLFPLLMLALLPVSLLAQSPEDRAQEVLDFISGEPGKERDWDTFRSWFVPSAQFYYRQQLGQGKTQVQTLSLDAFVERVGPAYDAGFLEEELHVTSHEFNGIATVWQHYRATLSDGIVEEGINTLQLIQHDGQWLITSLMWVAESDGVEVPVEDFKEK